MTAKVFHTEDPGTDIGTTFKYTTDDQTATVDTEVITETEVTTKEDWGFLSDRLVDPSYFSKWDYGMLTGERIACHGNKQKPQKKRSKVRKKNKAAKKARRKNRK